MDDINNDVVNNIVSMCFYQYFNEYDFTNILNKININIMDNNNNTILMRLSEYTYKIKSKKTLKILLDHKINPNIQNNNKFTALMFASKCFDFEIIKLLLDYNADPNMVDFYGSTPLLIYCDYSLKMFSPICSNNTNSMKIIKLLLKYNTDPNIKNHDGSNILMSVIKYTDVKIIKLLLDYKANPCSADEYGYNILSLTSNSHIRSGLETIKIIELLSYYIKTQNILKKIFNNNSLYSLKYINEFKILCKISSCKIKINIPRCLIKHILVIFFKMYLC